MKKPIIGITLDSENPGGYSKFPWYAIRKNYLSSIIDCGGIPFPLDHSLNNIEKVYSLTDGIIITGGNFDVDPSLYGQKKMKSRSIKNERTEFEMKICNMCIENNKPILGICGGEQLINVCCGGTLIQDIKNFKKNTLEHEQINSRNETSHDVIINKDTQLFNIIKTQKISVNSAHHQAVDKLGQNIIASGVAEDGIIESIEKVNHAWCIGVQWHPEFLITNSDKELIKNFIKASMN